MSIQTQTLGSQQQKQFPQKNRPVVVAEQIEGQISVTSLLGRLPGKLGNTSTQAQATRLSNPNLLMAQRQAVATQIGQMQGNFHLQKVLKQMHQVEQQQEKSLPHWSEIKDFLSLSSP